MSTIREISISSVGEPAHVKLEKNSKGYNFELSLYGDDLNSVLDEIFVAKGRVEQELI